MEKLGVGYKWTLFCYNFFENFRIKSYNSKLLAVSLCSQKNHFGILYKVENKGMAWSSSSCPEEKMCVLEKLSKLCLRRCLRTFISVLGLIAPNCQQPSVEPWQLNWQILTTGYHIAREMGGRAVHAVDVPSPISVGKKIRWRHSSHKGPLVTSPLVSKLEWHHSSYKSVL